MDESREGAQLLAEYRFLVDEHGFSLGIPTVDDRWNETRAIYTHIALRIEVSYNDRDSYDTSLRFPVDESAAVSIGVLESALGNEQQAVQSGTDVLSRQATFARTHIEQLLHTPAPIVADLQALRFYHTPRWRMELGHAIEMDAPTIGAELARLDRLRRFFAAPRA